MRASNGPDWVEVFLHPVYLNSGSFPLCCVLLWIPLISHTNFFFSLQSHHVPLIINSLWKRKKKMMMMLGKRARAPVMRRTTSMSSGMTVDAQLLSPEEPSDPIKDPFATGAKGSPSPVSARVLAAMDTAHFLRTCGLCKRPLAPGQDIYMYR